MAARPIFVPIPIGSRLVQEITIDFVWSPGFAPIQKKKNVAALHETAANCGYSPILEISTKSENKLGIRLSAFNFPVQLEDGREIPLECAFQGSKVFENGGPFRDIYLKTSREAKRDERLRSSGRLISFQFEGYEFPNEPKTAFYDWLYCRFLAPHKDYLQRLDHFKAFSDIEFNPGKSINCQARSCALFLSLCKKGLLEEAIQSPDQFIRAVSEDSFLQPYSNDTKQGKLF